MIILMAGNYKTGKTVSAHTFPKPIISLDLDNGSSSIKHATDKLGKLIVPNTNDIEIIKFIRKDYANTDFRTISKDEKISGAPSYAYDSYNLVGKMNETLNDIANGNKKCRTLIIDSLSALFVLWKDSVLHMNKIFGIRIQDYGTLDRVLFHQFIPNLKLLDNVVDYVILTCHIEMDKDELTGKIIEFPVGPSKPAGNKMGREFDEIWLQSNTNGIYEWRTKPHGFFQSGSRLHLPDPIIPATYQQLKKLVPTMK